MVFDRNRLLIINELLKETELISVEELKKRIKEINHKIDRRGIDRDHLEPLTKEGIIEYGSLPKPRDNKPPGSVDAVRIAPSIEALRKLFAEYPDNIKLHWSAYCQNMINSELIEKIKTEWDYPKNIDIKKGGRIRPEYTGNLEKTGERFVKFDYWGKDYVLSVLSDEQVRDMLRLSPSALRTFISTKYEMDGLFGQVKADEKLKSASFNEILILNLILDLRNPYLPKEGIKILVGTQININLQIQNGAETTDILGKRADNLAKIYEAENITSQGLSIEEKKKQREELRKKYTEYFTLVKDVCYQT
jgi:hypothetical protein